MNPNFCNKITLLNNWDSKCVLIGRVCFHNAMKQESEITDMIGCFTQIVRIYSFIKEIKIYVRTSYIVFLFVKSENNNFIKEINHVLHGFIAR